MSAATIFDDIVVGVGGSGSQLFTILPREAGRYSASSNLTSHTILGSSHGLSRIIRKAYHESPEYFSLVERSYELWKELEEESGQKLFTQTGCLNVGPPDSQVFQGALYAAKKFGLAHEVMDAGELISRYPAFRVPSDVKALLQPEGGFLEPEKCIVSYVEGALKADAQIHAREKVLSWQVDGGRVVVTTDRGTYQSKKLVFTSGSWMSKLASGFPVQLQVERQAVGWFYPKKPECSIRRDCRSGYSSPQKMQDIRSTHMGSHRTVSPDSSWE